jgi:hypothetical protein
LRHHSISRQSNDQLFQLRNSRKNLEAVGQHPDPNPIVHLERAIGIDFEDQSHDIEYNMLLLRIMYVLVAVNAPMQKSFCNP